MNSLPPWKAGQPLSASRLNRFEEKAITEVSAGPGLRALRSGNGLSISLGDGEGLRVRVATLIIESATQDGSNWRWTYTAKRANKQLPGWDGFLADPSSDTYRVFNMLEYQNDDNLPNGVGSILPVEVGLPVLCVIHFLPDGRREAWCNVPNNTTCA